MRKLTGSQKQIEWANNILDDLQLSIDAYTPNINKLNDAEQKILVNALNKLQSNINKISEGKAADVIAKKDLLNSNNIEIGLSKITGFSKEKLSILSAKWLDVK